MKFHKLDQSEKKDLGKYLKLADGDSVIGVPRGEIYSFKMKWENGKSVILPESNPSKHNRFKVNFVIKDGNEYLVKVWEFGVMIYTTLSEFSNEMDLSKTKIKITRNGMGTDTVYTLIPLGQVDTKAFDHVSLNILDSDNKPKDLPPMPSEDDELPF